MRPIALCLVAIALACSNETTPRTGIATRIALDRETALVGDRVGITIEIDTPPGYSMERPALPGDAVFESEAFALLPSLSLPDGRRHRVLWTLRPRDVGEHALPKLELPLVEPNGRVRLLPIGGAPLEVRSVREVIGTRDTFFDIRPAPKPSSVVGALAAAVLVLGLLAFVAFAVARRRRRGEIQDPTALLRETFVALEAALALSDPRARADALALALRHHLERRWGIRARARTPSELRGAVTAPWPDWLEALDHARFPRIAQGERIALLAQEIRGSLEHVDRV